MSVAQYIYDSDGFLIQIYQGQKQMPNSTTKPPLYVAGFTPRFVNGEWINQALISPIRFKLLFTSAERLKLKELRANDPALDDFFEIIEDPRLETVDLTLASTKEGVAYCLNLLVSESFITQEIADERLPEILSGKMQ